MKNTILTFIFSFALSLTHLAQAQVVTTVKGNKALLDMGGESWSVGEKVFAVDAQGKKKALMQIKQVKNGKAITDIMKGVPANGMSVVLAKKSGSSASGSSASKGAKAGSAYGFSGSFLMSTMKISNFKSNSFDMTGTTMGAGMFYDYPLSSSWFVRGNGTVEMFDVKKKLDVSICKNSTSTDCNASFVQAGFYGTFNFIFTPSPYRFWAGLGGGALIYLSKSSTVLSTNDFFFNTVVMGAAGLDIFTSHNTFIPITLEYQTIPDKEAAVTSMGARIGWGKTF